MARTAVPDRITTRAHTRRCGNPSCAATVRFEFDDAAVRELTADESMTARATCPTCGDPQHIVLWSTGELSGPWLDL